MNALSDFFFTNGKLRIKVYGVSGGITVAYTLFNLGFLHRPEELVFRKVAWVMLLSMLVLSTVFILWQRKKASLPVGKLEPPKLTNRFILFGSLAVIFLLLMVGIDMPAYQAFFADIALRSLATKFSSVNAASLSPGQIHSATKRLEIIVNNSTRGKIPVNPDTLTAAQNNLAGYLKTAKLPEQTKQAAYSVAIDLQTAAYQKRIEAGQTKPREIAKQGYSINSPLELTNSVSYIGNHSLMMLGEDIFVHNNANVVFEGIDFLAHGGQLHVAPDSSLLVIESIFQDGIQSLDDITWVNVMFRNTYLKYNHGALRLRNVTFKDCRLTTPPFFLPPEISNAITSDSKEPVNFVLEPTSANER